MSKNNLKEALTKQIQGGDAWSMMVEQRLNKLFIEDRQDMSAEGERVGLHASSILKGEDHFCYREMVLALFFKQDQGADLPLKMLKIFAAGNAIHEKWYRLFRKAGIDVAIERTLFLDDYDLSFTIDALLDILGEEVVCDVKSQGTFIFKKAKGHPSGEKQVNFYLWALTVYTGVPHRRGFVLVDNKDSQELRIVPVIYSKEKVRPYVERLKKIQELKKDFLVRGKLPPRKFDDPNCKRCAECNLRSACWKIGMGRVYIDGQKRKAKEKG